MENQDSIGYCEQKPDLQSSNCPVRISQGRPFTIALSNIPSFGIQRQAECAISLQIQQCGGSADGQDVTQYFLKHPDKDRIRYLASGITCYRWKLYPQSASSKIAAQHRRLKSPHFSVEKNVQHNVIFTLHGRGCKNQGYCWNGTITVYGRGCAGNTHTEKLLALSWDDLIPMNSPCENGHSLEKRAEPGREAAIEALIRDLSRPEDSDNVESLPNTSADLPVDSQPDSIPGIHQRDSCKANLPEKVSVPISLIDGETQSKLVPGYALTEGRDLQIWAKNNTSNQFEFISQVLDCSSGRSVSGSECRVQIESGKEEKICWARVPRAMQELWLSFSMRSEHGALYCSVVSIK